MCSETVSTDSLRKETICPRFPEPVPLTHPLPVLKQALDQVSCSAALPFDLWETHFGHKIVVIHKFPV